MKQTSVQGLVLILGLVGYIALVGMTTPVMTADAAKSVIKSRGLK